MSEHGKAAPYVGRNVRRKEGRRKLTGAALYVDDLKVENCLYGITIRSTVPRARIVNIDFSPDINWSDYVVVTADDIGGNNVVALMDVDQPYLAKDRVNHAGEAIVLLAHTNKEALERAREKIHVEYDEEPAVFSIEDSEVGETIVWREDNIFKRFLIEKGDTASQWEDADLVLEGEYFTGAQEQLYIEPQGVIAYFDDVDGVCVEGSIQCPYYIHKALKSLFDFPNEKVRIIQAETGGGFGGKEEYPNMIAGHAALLAQKAGRPVKLIYDRAEDMQVTTKRHPSRTRIKTAVRADGTLLAIDIEFALDGGAYLTLTPVVLSRGTIHAAGPYRCEHVRVESKALATNLPPHGAFRGFGAPQSIFAMERHLDRLAMVLDMDPADLRRINFLKKGDTTATGQLVKENVDLEGVMQKALCEIGYEQKMKAYQNDEGPVTRGVGFATFFHGAGFTGSGEKFLESVVELELTQRGTLKILAASTEIGQGTNTVFSQITADAMGIPYEWVEISKPDTKVVPDSGPTVASRTTMVVGSLVERAAAELKERVRALGGDIKDPESMRTTWVRAIKEGQELRARAAYQPPGDIEWDEEKYRGEAYATYAYACYAADVEVDHRTFETKVLDFVAVQEVGNVIHPTLAAGQIEGGVAQAIGFGIHEKVVWKDGLMANNQMTNYIMATSEDIPNIKVFFVPGETREGPSGGAKGIGELPMDGGAPAVLNAVVHATGVDVCAAPMLPEDLMNYFDELEE